LACYAAARNVEKFGVVPVTKEDLNKGTVWTNGVFDILHTGHLELLKFARNQGKKLIVGINDDASVRRLKGEGRPVNDYATRKRQLEMLPWVDEVVLFTEDTPQRIIEEIKPDIIVKGGDYTVSTTVGNELARVIIFPTVEGFSTTKIIDRLQS
jgi:D-beta-D-heptose 7-phosphate kinase/D-beta-D-heptose 1-phosphate adenosyltransferase